jgi:Domain of unknown function (DUF4398)
MRFMLGRIMLPFTIFSILVISSCGPVEYMGQVGMKARKSISSARQANAEKYSPYEYWSAKYYIERARYKAGYADYQDAVRYGEKSEKFSKKARSLSQRNKSRNIDLGKEGDSSASGDDSVKPQETPKIKLKLDTSSNKSDGGAS